MNPTQLFSKSARRSAFLKVFLVSLILLATSFVSYAQIEYEGLFYNLDQSTNTCEVTKSTGNLYSGDIIVPSKISYNGEEYCVRSIGEFAFSDCRGITSVTIPNTVTSIGGSAFSKCSSLTSLTLPNSVTTIGSWAFNDCSGLASIILGNSLTEIGRCAFNECYTLTSLDLPNSLISIGWRAFYNCNGLASVTIPNSVVSIDYQAFKYCSRLKKVYFNAENCEDLLSNTFPNYLEEVVIGENVKRIPASAFSGCRGLESVTLPNSVTSVGNNAFNACSGLVSISLPNTLTTIGASAFSGCSSLTSVTIPTSVTSIGSKAFRECSSLKKVYFEAENCEDLPHTFSLVWPYQVEEVVIGEKVKRIPAHAFESCSRLSSLTISNSVTSIGSEAFKGCRLDSLTIPNSVITIDSLAFCSNSHLESLIIGNSVKSIGGYAFNDCSGLKSLIIPDCVTSIGYGAFSNCFSLSSVSIGNSITSISNSAFSSSSLISVIIPPSVTSIGENAFYNCKSLASVTIPNSVISINKNAFYKCDNLTMVRTDNLSGWARIAFENNTANPLYYAHNLYLNDNAVPVKSIVIEGQKPIGTFAFTRATCLEKVRIKDADAVGTNAFDGCSNLTDICVKTAFLAENAFIGCGGINNIYVPCDIPPSASDNSFSNYAGVKLYVPQGRVSKYNEASTCWWKFSKVFESDFSSLDTLFIPDYDDIETAIDDVEKDVNMSSSLVQDNRIYNLQGILLRQNATPEDIKSLAPGLYIFNGKKILVK